MIHQALNFGAKGLRNTYESSHMQQQREFLHQYIYQ